MLIFRWSTSNNFSFPPPKLLKPYVPDAWINTALRDPKDGEVGRVGYEIDFNRYFYEYQPPRPLEEIEADIKTLEKEIIVGVESTWRCAMQSLTLHTSVGKDGILKIETPIGITNAELEVVLVVHPIEEAPPIPEWPANFFTEIVGGWEGAPLVREPQGTYETRSEFK